MAKQNTLFQNEKVMIHGQEILLVDARSPPSHQWPTSVDRHQGNERYYSTHKKGVLTNVVALSKKRCFHGGVGIDNEVICNGYIRRGDVIAENHQKTTGSK